MGLAQKTLFITGASRGIGLAIALRAARDGANIAIAAKTTQSHAKLPGTIYSAAREIEAAGGHALPLVVDVRHEDSVRAAIEKTAESFGGIDICVNNASAISPTDTPSTDMKRYDLMHQINVRGAYLVAKLAIPFLLKAENPHVLNLSPPLDLQPHWFGPNVAYTMSKFAMSMCAIGMAEEFRDAGVAFNTLWPISTIDTSAVRFVLGGETISNVSRIPEIMADAAYVIFNRRARDCTGQSFIDELVLREAGVSDFAAYAVDGSYPLCPDMFVADATIALSDCRFGPRLAH